MKKIKKIEEFIWYIVYKIEMKFEQRYKKRK